MNRLADIWNKFLETPPRAVVRAVRRRLGLRSPPDASHAVRGFELAGYPPPVAGRVEAAFARDDGTPVPILADYRYGVKSAWRNVPSLHGLAELDAAGALDAGGRALLARARGTRALAIPLAELDAAAGPILRANEDRFLPGTLAPGAYPAARARVRSALAAMRAHARQYGSALDALGGRGVYAPRPRPRAIEIGAGQGTACAALATLGFETTAIDNDYAGTMDSGAALAAAVAAEAAVRVRFERADITRRTSFAEGEFDLAISNSVLEHIPDLRAALRESARILAPGGVAIHRYHPFFGPSGGHAFGTLDSPWAHVRLTASETERYLDTLRAHEAPLAKPWIAQALTRNWPIARVQAALGECGLELLSWTERPAAQFHLRGLDGEILADALTRNPGVSIADLTADTVEFVCRRAR